MEGLRCAACNLSGEDDDCNFFLSTITKELDDVDERKRGGGGTYVAVYLLYLLSLFFF